MLFSPTENIDYKAKVRSEQPSDGRDRPRIWWCPTGGFAHLPLHAAGANSKWCSDYVVSPYTPTLAALIGARSSFAPIEKRRIKALVAAVPISHVGGWVDLLSTLEEAKAVRASMPDGTLIALRDTEDSLATASEGITAEALLANLPDTTILHLACHGHQNSENALQSGFVMSNVILTIESLIPVPLPYAFMAFLSACETAKGDKVSLYSTFYSLSEVLNFLGTPFRVNQIKLFILLLRCCSQASKASSPQCGQLLAIR
jgi:CHAT domain-containing protein